MIAFITFRMLPAVVAFACTSYLVYFKLNKSRYDAMMERVARKYKNTPFYKIRIKAYTTKYLFTWLLITAILLLNLVFNAK
jgi:hypothetical protein